MDCRDVERVSPLYWTNELDTQSLLEFEVHLKSCAPCAYEMQQQRHFDTLLRDAVLQDATETAGLQGRIRRLLSRESVLPGFFARPGARLATAAALLLVLVGSWVAYRSLSPSAAARTLFADAADDHSDEVIRKLPRRWVYRPSEIADLVQRRIGDERLVTSLAPAGYHIDRATVCNLLDRNYVHLVYTDGQNEVTIFVRRNDGEAMTGSPVARVDGKAIYAGSEANIQVSGFLASGLTVLVVDDLPRKETITLAEQAAAGV